jgi:hypothetical protein
MISLFLFQVLAVETVCLMVTTERIMFSGNKSNWNSDTKYQDYNRQKQREV